MPATDGYLSLVVFTRFYPSIGGIETLTDVLAREWIVGGHRVTIVTDVAAVEREAKQFPFPVLHRPRVRDVLRAVREADLVVHNNISLRAIWPLFVLRRPFVAVHHGFYCALDAHQPWLERLKAWIARRVAFSISVSRAIRTRLGCDGALIPNSYDDAVFRDEGRIRDKDLIFVGRLVSDKGVSVLIDALFELKQGGLTPSLTIVGDGPERANLKNQVARLGLTGQVTFTGRQNQAETASILNEHRIMVVPSLWNEPFGIVALEGAACGCVVVGSSGGGLPEAIGPCGVTFPNGDHRQLATVLGDLFAHPERLEFYRQAAPAHLAKHRADVVAAKYIDFFYEVLRKRGRNRRATDAG